MTLLLCRCDRKEPVWVPAIKRGIPIRYTYSVSEAVKISVFFMKILNMNGPSPPPPPKKVDFFQTKCKKYSAYPEKLFHSNHFSLFSPLYIGSKEIFLKKGEKKSNFIP